MIEPEELIVKQINLKKVEGYKYLYDNYYSSLSNFSSRIISQKKGAEDIVQDVFLRLWKGNSKFDSLKALTSYLFLSVKNTSLNAIRNEHRLLDSDITESLEIVSIGTDDKTIEQILIEEEFYRQIYVAINKLSPERKNVILLSMEGLSNKEIADKSGISVNTVKTLKLNAYRILRDELEHPVILFFMQLVK